MANFTSKSVMRSKAKHKMSTKLNTLLRSKASKVIKSGFPRQKPFQTKEEIADYFNTPLITCLLCGKCYKWLSGSHLRRTHCVTEDEYRNRYHLPHSIGLIGTELRSKWAIRAKEKLTPGDGITKGTKLKQHRSVYKEVFSLENIPIDKRNHIRDSTGKFK